MSETLARPAVAAGWPDWTGEACAIVASGPSVNKAEVASLKGRLKVLAIKKNVEIAPFADAVYGCDRAWWKSVRGLQDYHGLKLAYDDRGCGEFGLKKVRLPDCHKLSNEMLFDEVGLVGGGGNSGFQALNLVAQWGAVRILLLGFDCQRRSGVHWYGRNEWYGGGNPDESSFRRWKAAFETAAGQLAARGIEVINASPISDLKGFRKAGVAETLERWGL